MEGFLSELEISINLVGPINNRERRRTFRPWFKAAQGLRPLCLNRVKISWAYCLTLKIEIAYTKIVSDSVLRFGRHYLHYTRVLVDLVGFFYGNRQDLFGKGGI